MKKLLISPHSDDATLFAAFTCQREQPTILTLYSSFTQPARGFKSCAEEIRREEDRQAARILGCSIEFASIPDNLSSSEMAEETDLYLCDNYTDMDIECVWLPLFEIEGHAHHNLCKRVCGDFFGSKKQRTRVEYYPTYTPAGKSIIGAEVFPACGAHIAGKLRAMACYTSQLDMTPGIGCWPHFVRDLCEYVVR